MQPERVDSTPAAVGPVVVFDGVCNLCSGVVQALLRLDRKGTLHFASLQGSFGQRVVSTHHLERFDSILFVDGDTVKVESDAVIAIASSLGGPWRIFAVGSLVPRAVRDPIYRFVARRRFRWFGRRDECLIPTPELRARFLD